MIRLLQYLIFGHIHKWEDIADSRFTDGDGESGSMVYCKCVTCGTHRYFKHARMKKRQ